MERWVDRVALVTGASSGIGAATAELLVKHGMSVIGCARNIQPIQNLAAKLKDEKPGKLTAIKCDLSKEIEILDMFESIKTEHGGVDVCINNAGFSYDAPLLSANSQPWKEMLDVNVMGLCICTREAFKSMKERNIDDGHIININSMSGKRMVSNKSSFYSATKYAVSALCEGVRNELREMGSHIRLSQISPGIVQTEFHPRKSGEERAKKLYESMKCLQPEDIAAAVEYILAAPPHVQVHDVQVRPIEQKF